MVIRLLGFFDINADCHLNDDETFITESSSSATLFFLSCQCYIHTQHDILYRMSPSVGLSSTAPPSSSVASSSASLVPVIPVVVIIVVVITRTIVGGAMNQLGVQVIWGDPSKVFRPPAKRFVFKVCVRQEIYCCP